ncbi:zf-TFIIB domain-containing protein [Tepidiforma sp.]|uniref:TFIIB-type zinc ribbon-containing protein n=1 Tax=Tepidiforma sp. TaxID=2682230 RepID=UPI002ADE159E|nr:zf-TFIIB domain-containing protein [Tepidiforma sp.]
MTSPDDAWLRAARARAADGSWERSADEIFAELRASRPGRPAPAGAPCCPACPGRPALQPFHRRENPAPEPFWLCARCAGAWVPRAAAVAPADPADLPAGLLAATAWKAPEHPPGRPCPACSLPLQTLPGAVALDQCSACGGTWFDAGEFAALHGLASPRPPRESEAAVDQPADIGDAASPWLVALDLLLRLAGARFGLRL